MQAEIKLRSYALRPPQGVTRRLQGLAEAASYGHGQRTERSPRHGDKP